MAVLVLHATHHVRHFVERSEARRPVGDGQSRIIAGDKRPGNNEDKRDAGGEDGEAVQPAVVRDFDAFQNSPHLKRDAELPGTFPETQQFNRRPDALDSPTLVDFIPIKAPAIRVTAAGQTHEFLDAPLRVIPSALWRHAD
jgi:hypothetical protein